MNKILCSCIINHILLLTEIYIFYYHEWTHTYIRWLWWPELHVNKVFLWAFILSNMGLCPTADNDPVQCWNDCDLYLKFTKLWTQAHGDKKMIQHLPLPYVQNIQKHTQKKV